MITKTYKQLFAGIVVCALTATLISCTEDFLEVKNPTGEPLEEY